MTTIRKLKSIHQKLHSCRACPQMCGEPVTGKAIETSVMLIGQAPGVHEGAKGRPFAYTAGQTLFKWLNQSTGMMEPEARDSIYFSAIARCFPGKSVTGSGDRVPTSAEIENCRPHLRAEIQTLKPKIILAVGKLAISEVLGPHLFPKNSTLDEAVGKTFETKFHDIPVKVIPLPHPSGLSRWPKLEPGKTKLNEALILFAIAYKALFE